MSKLVEYRTVLVKAVICLFISFFAGYMLYVNRLEEGLVNGEVWTRVLNTIFVSMMVMVICYIICNINRLYSVFIAGEKQGGLYAIYFALTMVLMLFNPLSAKQNEMSNFTRIIGAGVIENVDVLKRVNNFKCWFICFAICFVLFFLLANYIKKKVNKEDAILVADFLDKLIVVMNVELVLRCITYFSEETKSLDVFHYSTYMLMLIFIAGIVYIILGFEEKISANYYMQIMLIGSAASYSAAVIAQEGKSLIVVQGCVLFVLLFLINKCKNLFQNDWISSLSKSSSLIIVMIPFVTSFYIELMYILTQYSIFITYPKRYYVILMFCMFICCFIGAYIIKKKRLEIRWWKKWSLPIMIFGISCLSVQLPLQRTYTAHIFEEANSSILISDFLNFGSIPIVEHYGGHMMFQVWEGIIYGILNNDAAGAIFSPYSVYLLPVLAVLYYYLIKIFLDENIALWVALLIPFYGAWHYYGLGMLGGIAIIAYVRKNSYVRAALMWLALIWCAFYRLDLGFAFGVAGIGSLLLYFIVSHKWKALKPLLLTFAGWVLLLGGTWLVLCVLKDINPLLRIWEFLQIALSNQNWAYTNIGDTGNTIFAWCYIIIPFSVIVCLLYLIFVKEFRKKIGREKWILLLFLGISYIVNFSRGIVRHSLVDMTTYVIIWTAYIFLALFISCFRKTVLLVPIFCAFFLGDALMVSDSNYASVSIADNAVSRIGFFAGMDNEISEIPWEQLRERQETVSRVKWDDDIQKDIYPYQYVMDMLLDEKETFLDFMNRSFVYSAINRKNPAYVSQLPMQLSGEFTQERFIEEIQCDIDKIPLAIMPVDNINSASSLDGIANVYRYYKVAEFIYQNYVPLCQYGSDFAVWCLADRYEDMQSKLSEMGYEAEYINDFAVSENFVFHDSRCEQGEENQSVTIIGTGNDPRVEGLESIIDTSEFKDNIMSIYVEYESDRAGELQVFYTTEELEQYTSNKMISNEIGESGVAIFPVPVTEHTRLRLDIPEHSRVTIKSLCIKSGIVSIDYGYDGPTESVSKSGNIDFSYNNGFHDYELNQLPRIWAEYDEKDAASNRISTVLKPQDGVYYFENNDSIIKQEGNYLLLTATYNDSERVGNDTIGAVMKLGIYEGGIFREKFRYSFVLTEGSHDYIFRVSSDYNWYFSDINAVQIQCESQLSDMELKILEGD